MNLFKNPNAPQDDSSEESLREWGEAERTAPPMRRGRFASITDRLTGGAANTASPRAAWLRPTLALGGASLVALAVSFTALAPEKSRSHLPESVVSAPVVEKPAADVLSSRPLNADKWGDGKLTRLENGLSVRTDAVFIGGESYGPTTGYRHSAVVPFVVTIKNDGAKPFTGKITVNVGYVQNPDRVYSYPVTIAANTVFRTTVYPEIAEQLGGGSQTWPYTIKLSSPGEEISLDSGFVRIGRNGSDYNYGHESKSLAILDERVGVLTPRNKSRNGRKNAAGLEMVYGKPENAPNRAIGYDAIDVLALGYGCEKLTPAQWAAIREWVKDGGSLVLLGGSEQMRRVLATPEALALSPAERFATAKPTRAPRLEESAFDQNPLRNGFIAYRRSNLAWRLPEVMTTAPRVKADGKVLLRSAMRGETQWATVGARRTLGAGTVAFYGFDPTIPEFREDSETLEHWWGGVARRDAGMISTKRMRLLANYHPWERGEYENGSFHQEQYVRGELANNMGRNPFITHLPDLKVVLYIFLGYFVLVVPVSFVVLKQTRRMQYAWFTGPLLALTFAGGLALFTRSLYEASQSLRTSGVLALEAGDGVGRFHGVTELYAPKAGRLSLALPGTQLSFSGASEYYGASSETAKFTPRISDNGSGEQPPSVDVPNLSFRRFHHSQTMTLGEGITATFRPDDAGAGTLIGTIKNRSGLTLRDVTVLVRGEKTDFRDGATRTPVWVWRTGRLTPGTHFATLYVQPFRKGQGVGDYPVNVLDKTAASLPPRTPILTARTSGEAFAPVKLGKWVGGESSVQVLVKLPAIPEDIMPEYVPQPEPGAAGGPPPPGFSPPPGESGAEEGGNNR